MLLGYHICSSLIFFQLSLLAAGITHGGEFDAVALFRVIEDKVKCSKSPESCERLILTEGGRRHEYYVDRNPTYVIKDQAVVTIVVKKVRKFGSTPDELREFAKEVYGKGLKSGQKSQPDSPMGYSHDLLFRIALEEGKRFITFANANLKRTFNVRINNQNVGVLSFEIPFDQQTTKYMEFTIPLLEGDSGKIKKLLSPFSGKIIWE